MRILVFGATGSIGRHVVEQAVGEGHAVTAFARDPMRVPERAGVTAVQGDVLDARAVERAMGGQDAVLCCLGAGLRGGVRAEGTLNIVRAMERSAVRRLVCQTTLGAGESRGNLDFFWKYIMFGVLLRAAYRDHELQEECVRASALDWTIVRPAAFTDGPRTGAYRHGFAADDRALTLKISRADVADFMLKQLANSRYLREAPGLSY
jgi:putative NADH-flavin reductase